MQSEVKAQSIVQFNKRGWFGDSAESFMRNTSRPRVVSSHIGEHGSGSPIPTKRLRVIDDETKEYKHSKRLCAKDGRDGGIDVDNEQPIAVELSEVAKSMQAVSVVEGPGPLSAQDRLLSPCTEKSSRSYTGGAEAASLLIAHALQTAADEWSALPRRSSRRGSNLYSGSGLADACISYSHEQQSPTRQRQGSFMSVEDDGL